MNGEPYYVPLKEGSGAGEIEVDGHWACNLTASDGSTISGWGNTREAAQIDVTTKHGEYERRLLLPVKEQLKILIKENPTYFDCGVHNKALRMLAQIVLGEKI